MDVQLAKIYRALDGAEACFIRVVDLPGLPFVGLTMSVDEEFLRVTAVHVYVGGPVVAVVGDPDAKVPLAMAPKNRVELEAFIARTPPTAGWRPLPKPAHLRLVET